MNKINLIGRVLEAYNRQTQQSLFNDIQIQINSAVDGYLFPVVSVNSAYTMSLNDCLILGDATSAGFTITLKPAGECKQKLVIIKKTNSANTITIDGDGSETIDGATTQSLTTQYSVLRLMSDGTKWHIV